jgi:NAD-dependent dihydropyrimidine dehydrogenase PreA subunit
MMRKEVAVMTIESIDTDLCNGCGICVDTCSADVIRMDDEEKKAVIKYPEDCLSCALCEFECPQNAIYVSPTVRVL